VITINISYEIVGNKILKLINLNQRNNQIIKLNNKMEYLKKYNRSNRLSF